VTLYELQVVGDPRRVLLAVGSNLQHARRLCYAVAKLPSTTRLRARRSIAVGTDSRPGVFVGEYRLPGDS
jgi:hypothetical protein